MWNLRLACAALFLASSCGGAAKPEPTKSTETPVKVGPEQAFALADQAKAGVDSAELQSILVEHWDQKMRNSPVWASTMGDHRFDDRLSDPSSQALMKRRVATKKLLESAKSMDASSFSERDRVTLALFVENLDRSVEREVCESYQWSVSARGNPVSSFNVMPDDHKVVDLVSAQNLVKRYQQIPASIAASIANLRTGLAEGRVANAESIRLTIALVKGQLESPIQEWPLLKPVAHIRGLSAIPEETREELASALEALVAGEIKTAYGLYHQMLESELLPKGRSGDQVGAHALPDGLACYEASIRGHINLPRTAKEIHELGLTEISRINSDMAKLGKKLFRAKNLAATVKTLRTKKDLYFDSKEEIIAKAESSLAKAKAAMPAYFGILPESDCTVVEIPEFEAPYTTIAYYRQPQAANDKPGEYFINTFKPETRPRFEMEVLAYHESIPGHHLQIAISQERHDLPLFRRHGGSTAFVEGWALYTERLADEMGLYSGDLDRMGMLSYDAWRASRLVVDTGIHAMGWTREQAEKFMEEHTALTKGNIRNEVDRYISWPGQAVAYKVGQLEILRLREEAKAALGERFDLKQFHDVVLKFGAVTLPVLAEQVKAWTASVPQ
jgi:uncharacterized protein (DUF885 family)